MGERDSLLQSSFHTRSLDQVYHDLETSLDGLSTAQAKKRRNLYGLNNVPSPVNAPAWLCCLLPCLLRTKEMLIYNDSVPEHAIVKRNGKWINMDSASLVPGDIVKIDTHERIPADIRLIEVDNCIFSTNAVYNSNSNLIASITTSSDKYVGASNMGFLGYLVESGSCVGVVVATGKNAVISKLIKGRLWPPKTSDN
uniref:Uncharacterized protein n=1 Tax=Chromulina nebulosa TaxID=96789 RepID=A0A6T5VPP8_9STRA|mmetsp:Transcript_3980/g.3571  ORF Transcript_3980/g.3571 Transcript_3980/m.3571 type:complete len:197 (+) Transcript_3980:40-630(+)